MKAAGKQAGSQVPVWRKQPDLPSESSTRATEQSTPTPSRESSQVPRPPLHKSPTSPVLSNGMRGPQPWSLASISKLGIDPASC
ncbi:hypothetical protein AK812_SmicGene23461 [Symbiodinium microadriaticum]|uniref:Uncharacterized protein n=1 Tax=Symbiodinium microadriaticum TaxID=2951 RepID=A0A1Q9DH97_SYMMI|nr:hypothetical protein AK812_SmicGene23461 [Symbiodinium microadriaticum]